MAEVVGTVASAVTLASLFKLCLEVFDTIQATRNQRLEFKKLVLKFNIEKCRLYVWGQAMGLTSAGEPAQQCRLDHYQYLDWFHNP